MPSQRSSHWRGLFRLSETWLRLTLNWKHRPINQIRASWSQEGSKEPWLATKLFDLTRNAGADSVDDNTWMDLEFERLFSSVDSTLTRLGSQCLYRKLRIYRDDPSELEKDFATYQALRRNTALRERFQLRLWRLRRDSEALICETLFGEVAFNPPSRTLVLSMSAVSILAFAATVLHPTLWWILGVIVLCNAGIMAFLGHSVHETFMRTGSLSRMISVAERLARIDTATTISQPARLSALFSEAGDLRASFRWFLADRSNELIQSGFLWLNLLFRTTWRRC